MATLSCMKVCGGGPGGGLGYPGGGFILPTEINSNKAGNSILSLKVVVEFSNFIIDENNI